MNDLKKELSNLIDEVEKDTLGFSTRNNAHWYNRILDSCKEEFPDNDFIASQKKFRIEGFSLVSSSEILEAAECLLNELRKITKKPKDTPSASSQSNIVFNIHSSGSNMSFSNLVSQVQHSNNVNKSEIVQIIQEYKNELSKPNPDKNKLKSMLESLKNVGEDVVAGLLVETAKKLLGL
jgi:hypothetical protein